MITFNNVSFTYKSSDSPSLNDIVLSINKGEVVLLTGPSGCGKSTIIRLINGLVPHFFEGDVKGSVKVNGHDPVDRELYDTAESCGTVFQNPRSQFFHIDTDGELAFACENMGLPQNEILDRVDKTVKRFNLQSLMGRNLFKLSGGEKQKIACASVDTPDLPIILMDEPSSNLDLKTTNEIREIIKIWKDCGKTLVIAEHRLSYLWDIVDRVVLMDKGRIIKDYKDGSHLSITDEERKEMGIRCLTPITLEDKPYTFTDSLKIKDMRFSYKKNKVLDIDELDIPLNAITAIKGKNGRGKTSFLRVLSGMEKKGKFKAFCKGKEISKKDIKKNTFMVTQDVNHQLFTESVLDEVLVSQNVENENVAHNILKELDLDQFSSRHPLSLSGGQKQRVAVASAIASERELLLFDEPTSGLDYEHMIGFGKLLQTLKEKGKTVIVVTHDEELISYCDYTINLY